MKKRRFFSNQPLEESLINLTPLIDVVFVVLIAFILVAPLLEVDHIDLAPASLTSEKNISENSFISIYVRADNSIWMKKQPISLENLTLLLKEKKKLYPHQIPQLVHDKKAYFGTYQDVKLAVEQAGFDQMDVILQEKK
jgi:biopolymer transport protein ExbD